MLCIYEYNLNFSSRLNKPTCVLQWLLSKLPANSMKVPVFPQGSLEIQLFLIITFFPWTGLICDFSPGYLLLFQFFFFFFLITNTSRKTYPLHTHLSVQNSVNYRHIVVQQNFRTYASCMIETLCLWTSNSLYSHLPRP